MSHSQVLHCLNGHRVIAYSSRFSICKRKTLRRESRARFLPESRCSELAEGECVSRAVNARQFSTNAGRGDSIGVSVAMHKLHDAVCIVRVSDVSTINHRLAKNGDVVLEKNEEQKLIEEAVNASALVINSLFLALLFSFSLSHFLPHFFLLWIYKPHVHRIELHRVEFH